MENYCMGGIITEKIHLFQTFMKITEADPFPLIETGYIAMLKNIFATALLGLSDFNKKGQHVAPL